MTLSTYPSSLCSPDVCLWGILLSVRPVNNRISYYSADELLHKWQRDELTVEQMVGHLLQQILALLQRLAELESRLRTLEQSRAEGRKA
ncbi:MAG TPA: hypothetical protein PKE45_21455 [Caldilineaceae bacterium]|nr:hypothetical protein [Caldilineaceae bacterium]